MSIPLPLDIPLSLAGPALATTLAYLNAKYSLFYDKKIFHGLFKSIIKSRLAQRRDHLNLFYVLENHALDPASKDRPFIVYNGRSWTFHETYTVALRYGTWFKKVHGIKSREIVALDMMNSSTFIFIWLGLWSIGAVPAFINYNLTGKPLTHSIRTSTARLMIVDEEVRSSFGPDELAAFASPDFREDGGPVEVIFHTPEIEAQVLQTEAVREDDKARGGFQLRDMAALIYTSGTTGLPKPAIVSWRKSWAGSVFVSHFVELTKHDRVFTVTQPRPVAVEEADVNLVHAALPFISRHSGIPSLSGSRVYADHRPQVLREKLHKRSARERRHGHPIRRRDLAISARHPR
jgi:acyl-CoA synthetase (AMP-forming)/AMP-acid ligase II